MVKSSGPSPDQLRERLRNLIVLRRGRALATEAPDAAPTVSSSGAEGFGDRVGGGAVADRCRRAFVERSLRVPLEFRNIPSTLEIVGNAPDNVDVRVRGSSALLSRLQPGEIVAVLDLESAAPAPGCSTSATTKCAPRSAWRSRRCAGYAGARAGALHRRTVLVKPALEGEPAAGFVIGRVSSEPATVEIVGPDTRVKQITEATTEPVSVDGARTRVRDIVTVGFPTCRYDSFSLKRRP